MQSKFTSPLLGYNNNVRHKARVFHIQTEDSGVKHPHIITHLFMDGGRILKSVKKSYAEYIGVDGMTDIVKTMMKEQHKAMFIALRDGTFDHLVDPPAAATGVAPAGAAKDAPSAAAVPAAGAAPASTGAPASGPASASSTSGAALASAKAAPSGAVASATPPPNSAVAAIAPPLSSVTSPSEVSPALSPAAQVSATERAAPPSSVSGQAAASSQPVATDASPPPASEEEPVQSDGATQIAASPAPPSLTLDIDALERAAKDAEGGSPMFHQPSDLPPPPENLFRDRPAASGYRAQGIEERPRSRPPATTPSARAGAGAIAPRPPPVPSSAGPGAGAGAAGSRPRAPSEAPRRMPPVPSPADARYAPTRPASIFGAPRPPPATSTSIFGGDLMSDKSLDEVILSYLAEDLELEGKKK